MKRLILQARGITRVFQAGGREVHALRRVDLALPEGDFAAILGPPGAGKSTLLRILGFLDS
ncbi:MAG TPA: ATP-binding cassette domain-containing protein, partial [Symbiobacteriaceae bacterium]|nr:ATP-binding cassette domain-containing protein [Symbiobacteriaceae bacterium]